MWLRKEKAGSAPGHTWENDGDVLEVPDELGLDLVGIPDGGFSEAPAPTAPVDDPPASEAGPDAAVADDPDAVVTEISEAPDTAKTEDDPPAGKAASKPSTRRSGTK